MTIGSQAQEKFDQGKTFGMTFSVIGRNIGLWLALTVIFSALPTVLLEYLLLELFADSFVAGPDLEWRLYEVTAVGMVASFVLYSLLTSSLTRATIEDLSGKKPSMRDCLHTARAVLLPAVGVGLLTSLGVVAGLALLIVPGIVLWLRWAVAVPVLVHERLGVTASISRSAALTAGFLSPLFGVALILFIAGVAIQWAAGMIQPMLGMWSDLFVAAVADGVVSMVGSTAAAVIYVELRRIKEGTSVDELAEIFS